MVLSLYLVHPVCELNHFSLCYLMSCSVPSEVNVLVPGAGLGRLAWEIARLGEFLCLCNLS